MTERTLSPIAASFRAGAFEILARREKPATKTPVNQGRLVLQPLKNGYRLDVIGADKDGKPQRLATAHYTYLPWARQIAGALSETMAIPFRDLTTGDGA